MTTTDKIISSIQAQVSHLQTMREFVEGHREAFDALQDRFAGPIVGLPDLFVHRCPAPREFAKSLGGHWKRNGGSDGKIDWMGNVQVGEKRLTIHLFGAELRDTSEIAL